MFPDLTAAKRVVRLFCPAKFESSIRYACLARATKQMISRFQLSKVDSLAEVSRYGIFPRVQGRIFSLRSSL